MRVIKGIYQNGIISLLEPVPLKDRQEVVVLIPDEGETPVPEALRCAGMLRDLSPEEAVAFDEALKRGVQFGRRTSIG